MSARLGRRDPSAPPGRPAHRMGARAARHPARGDHRRRGRVVHGARRGRRASSPAPTGSRRTATPRTRSVRTALAVLAAHHGLPLVVVAPTSTLDPAAADGRGDPDRGARRRRGDARGSPRATRPSTSRRRADRRDRDGARRPPPAVRRDAAPRGRRRPMSLDDGRRRHARAARAVRLRREAVRRRSARGSRRERSPRRPTSSTAVVEPPAPDDLTPLPEPGSGEWARGTPRPDSRRSPPGGSRRSCSPEAWRRASAASSRAPSRRSTGGASSAGSSARPARLGDGARRRDPGRADDELRDDDETRAHVAALGVRRAALVLAVRLAPAHRGGRSLSWRTAGASLYAPGHGDLLEAIRRSGTLAALRARGVSSTSRSRTSTTSARGSIRS